MSPNFKPYEFVNYRNHSLMLTNSGGPDNDNRTWPLERFLKSNKINGSYEARWEIFDSKFQLVELSNCDKEFKGRFDLKQPLLASWINGTLEIGIGKFKGNFEVRNYSYHLMLKIKKGIIEERKIINNFSNSYKYMFNFGKYKGQSIDKVINENLQYFDWALKNIDFFTIYPPEFEREFILNKIVNLTSNEKSQTEFDIVPVYKKTKYKFPKELIKLNKEKFERLNKVNFSSEFNCYTPDLKDIELFNEFGFYLDENYFKDDNYSQADRIYYNSNNWLSDAAGSIDPEEMNDVYWNLD